MSDVPIRLAPDSSNPSAKLVPSANRLRELADQLAHEGEGKIAAHVRQVAEELEAAAARVAGDPYS